MLNSSQGKEGLPNSHSLFTDDHPMTSDPPSHTTEVLQLLLFVDQRPCSHEQIRLLRKSLQELKLEYPFDLQVVDVTEQPYLAEHFKLVATPALIKIHPQPQQTLTGSNLIAQLKHSWPRWLRNVEEYWLSQGAENHGELMVRDIPSVICTAEIVELSDQVFRLKQEKEKLLEQLHFKDRIIAMLAHDLRNPLTAISLALQTLELTQKAKAGGQISPPSLSHMTPSLIKQARQQLAIVERLIKDLLEAAKEGRSQLNLTPQKVNFIEIYEELSAEFKKKISSKNLILKTDIPHDLPAVYIDRERIRQVLINLLDNAYKYTTENGTIKITALHRTSQKVQVTIADNGRGIPEENLQHIFEDHFRLQRDFHQEGYGIGLGLCQRIIRAHYGQIWVNSTPNEGSQFHFTLPVYTQD